MIPKVEVVNDWLLLATSCRKEQVVAGLLLRHASCTNCTCYRMTARTYLNPFLGHPAICCRGSVQPVKTPDLETLN